MHKISVRNLVEFILRRGSIDTGFIVSTKRALEGTLVHQSIQKQRKKEVESSGGVYKKEVVLSMEYEYKGINFCVEGRADGVVFLENEVIVEEIKSTTQALFDIEKDTNHWHWAQAKVYAYMQRKWQESDTPNCTCVLIYGHTQTGEWITFTETFLYKEIEDFVKGLIKKYWEFAKLDEDRIAEGQETGQAASFPFSGYRAGQRELAVGVYTASRNKNKLFAQAPTGIGKTMATLFAAVKAVAEGRGEKIFYLTSKNV